MVRRVAAVFPPGMTAVDALARARPAGAVLCRTAGTLGRMAIAHSPRTVLDCPDAAALAAFYAELLGWSVAVDGGDDEWAEVHSNDGRWIAFQRVDGYVPPQWPGQALPQQMHLDVSVRDLDAGEAAVTAIGATKHEHQPGETFRVFLDPAGHPFCLCQE